MRSHRRKLANITHLLGLPLTCSTRCQTYKSGPDARKTLYLDHYPQYFAPDPAFPLPRELATDEEKR